LKAIMPMGSCDRRYTDDAHYIGGALGHTSFQWGALFKKVMAGPPDPELHGEHWRDMWRQRLEATPPILATWLQHQREDAYWKRGSVFEAPGDINVPAYLVSGWSDTYATSSLRLFANLKSPSKVMIGPWGHTYPYTASQGLDWAHEEVRWWRHWLMHEETGIMREPRVRVFLPEATASEGGPIPGRWIASEQWPPPARPQVFHLNAGELAATPTAAPSITHRDRGIVGATKPEWLDRLPIEQSHDDALSTVFDTSPLTAPIELTGEAELKLRIASDKPVAKIFVRLNDVRADGKSWPVTWAALNLTRRDSMSAPTPLEPSRIYNVTLKLRSAAYAFRAGSRIRLAVSEGFWPMLWPSPETPTLTLPMGVSTLTLPVRPAGSADGAFPIPQTHGADSALAYAAAAPDATGRLVLTTNTPAAPYRVEDCGIELSSSGEETSELSAGDPLSARWRQTGHSTWRRDGWDCAVEASYDLTSDAASFHIVETLIAHENGAEIFRRSSDRIIPRDLL
jgi:predicted acyl esterase